MQIDDRPPKYSLLGRKGRHFRAWISGLGSASHSAKETFAKIPWQLALVSRIQWPAWICFMSKETSVRVHPQCIHCWGRGGPLFNFLQMARLRPTTLLGSNSRDQGKSNNQLSALGVYNCHDSYLAWWTSAPSTNLECQHGRNVATKWYKMDVHQCDWRAILCPSRNKKYIYNIYIIYHAVI